MDNGSVSIKRIKEIKSTALEGLKGKWGIAIGVSIVYELIVGIPNAFSRNDFRIFAGLIGILIGGPMAVGLYTFFVHLIRKQNPSFSILFSGFRRFWTNIWAVIIVGFFTVLWMLLLIIPGIIASLRYSQTLYILQDHPDYTAWEAFQQSKMMMKGHKGRLFLLYLSFIGWLLLGILTLGIGYLWLFPYISASGAAFYDNLKNSNIPTPESTISNSNLS